jgi:4'-phosphopantetheinyl transferase EntD
MERDFGRVASRYVSNQEQGLCREEWWHAALWCAKEALYKMAQREGISLRDDIRVCFWDGEHSTLCAELFTGQQVELALKTLQGQMLVYTL